MRHVADRARSWFRGRTLCVVLGLASACSPTDPESDRRPTPASDAALADAAADAASDARSADGSQSFDDDGSVEPGCHSADPDNLDCLEICPEICNGRDDDCDQIVDEGGDESCSTGHATGVCQNGSCFVLRCEAGFRDCDQLAANGCEAAADDPQNCGACGRVCSIANASASCMSGQCQVAQCSEGHGDCDQNHADCETRTNTLGDCGGCGIACKDVPHAVPSCESGACRPGSCYAGYGDCDQRADNGCEEALDSLQHCGGCNQPCSKANCRGGVCTAADCGATPGYADCDQDEATCETNLQADVNNCTACGNKCQFNPSVTPHATLGCTAGGCTAFCDAGYGNCDGDYANGCEQPLNTLTHCGGCGVTCAIANASATCTNGSCQVQGCASDYGDCDGDLASCETPLNAPTTCGTCATSCDLPHANEGCGGSPGARLCTVASCEANWADCDGIAANGCERDVRSVSSGGQGPCVPDSNCTRASDNGHEYFFCNNAATWTAARTKCLSQYNGDLVQIADAMEDAFVRSRIGPISWIGSTDSAIEGLWIWANNGVPLWRGTANGNALLGQYTNWASGEPNASGNCGAMYASGQFDDANCNSNLPFVCEISPDACPADASKFDPGQCGCGKLDSDSDSDGFADCNDACPDDPTKLSGGICGCGKPDVDTDSDGKLDCQDGCPNDPAKIAVGLCGCGVADIDSDGDMAPDCQESCDNDPNKQQPGVCGCGVPDADMDGDGTLDCQDGCPGDDATTGACFPFTHSNFSTGKLNFVSAPVATLNCGTTTINTSNTPATLTNWCGTAPAPVVQTQSNGPEVVVIPLKGLSVASGSTLRLIGTRPVIFAVRGDVTIDGTIDANASGATPGAGGNWSCGSSVGAAGSGSAAFGAGGGGGGGGAFGSAGGRGGKGDNLTNYGTGGNVRGNANLSPLVGGCNGGQGGGCASAAGAGGGAVQITASGTLDINAIVRANGGNGAVGCSTEGGGAGGGSGGGVLLEANVIDTTGAVITANGGNGGDGIGLANGFGGLGALTSVSPGINGGDGIGAGGGGGGGYGRIKR